MAIYIQGIGAITIQNTLDKEWFSHSPISYNEPYVRCIEPQFNNWFSPLEARRMSRIIKRSIISSTIALEDSGVSMPDIIISGTGLGAVEDTEKFLTSMIKNGENYLQPSFFIQSTHNSISSQIAIKIKCHGYNNTHVHRGVSFESALLEGVLLLSQGIGHTALIGGHDELTPTYFQLLKRIGYWRDSIEDSLNIIRLKGNGSFSGEGSISIMLTDEYSDNSYCELVGCSLYYCPSNINHTIAEFLSNYGIKLCDVDLIMTGANGNTLNDSTYDGLYNNDRVAYYKHISGEYFSSASFAVMCAAQILKKGRVSSFYTNNGTEIDNVKSILIHNHAFNKNHSLILLRRC